MGFWYTGHNPITIEGTKSGGPVDFLALRTKLARALDCPDGPKKLQFDDQDGKYYMAIVTGQPKFTEDIQTRLKEMDVDAFIRYMVVEGVVTQYLTNYMFEIAEEWADWCSYNFDKIYCSHTFAQLAVDHKYYIEECILNANKVIDNQINEQEETEEE